MFALTDHPIEHHPLLVDFADETAGAVVTFTGRVRATNAGRTVNQLIYEGAEALAQNEFAAIEQETLARFAVSHVRCVHRVGQLDVGATAVWIGILAAHRGPAFDACRYVIDELKKRLPIWKKEIYTDGDSGWINAP